MIRFAAGFAAGVAACAGMVGWLLWSDDREAS